MKMRKYLEREYKTKVKIMTLEMFILGGCLEDCADFSEQIKEKRGYQKAF